MPPPCENCKKLVLKLIYSEELDCTLCEACMALALKEYQKISGFLDGDEPPEPPPELVEKVSVDEDEEEVLEMLRNDDEQ